MRHFAYVWIYECGVFGGGAGSVLKLMNDLQINSKFEESGCCVLCVRDCLESNVWP